MWCLQSAYQFLSLVLFFLNFHANLSSSSSSSSITQLCSLVEASALIQFKSSLSINKTRSRSRIYYSWKEGTDCCSWDGVTCDHIKGHVIGLDLSCSWLYGTISSNSSLFQLPHLQQLNLAFNNFNHSNISSKFGEFASLVHFNLSTSSFAGHIPSQVSHLSNLVSLDLSENDYQTLDEDTFEGLVHNLTEVRQLFLDGTNMSSINPSVFMNLSSSLRSLSLEDCRLQGKFPENIFHLPHLKLLKLGYNLNLSLNLPKFNQSSHLEFLDLPAMSISTTLFDSIGNLVSLEHLNLYKSQISGPIPRALGNLSKLNSLDLSYNSLRGHIPRELGNLCKLKYLSLRQNYFSGQIPSSLIRNLTQLEFLSMKANRLEGSIPDEESAFPKLILLDLSYNLFNGMLPSWLYTIPSLKYIHLSHNQFNGYIKEFKYHFLERIELQNNQLQGPIPSSISQLVNLISLDLSSNKLQGLIPSSISQLLSLTFLDLSSNKLQGLIPSSISQLVNLTVLRLSSNNLSGMVELSKLQNLLILDLSSNSISFNSNGADVCYTLPNLQLLYLSSCNITEFPLFLRGSKSLLYLDLSCNRIYGKIPRWMQDVGKDSLFYLNLSHNSMTDIDQQLPWRGIKFLDLSSNLIHGDLPIPPSTANVFFISNNSLSREIPSQLCTASSLKLLDLSHNNLSGIIPQCFGNLSKSVLMLNLQMNKFRGIIPPTFIKGCQLRNLNLNGNQLEGPLTRSILNCSSLEVLDVGNNKIRGTFPHWLGSLPQLQVLVLRSNQLHGSMGDARSNPSFSKIQIFDLSSNYFSGTLPVKYIQNFNAMINLRSNESAGQYMGVNNSGSFYSYSIEISIKGVELEVTKIFTMLTSIDLSNNKFEGEIPMVIGKLNSLKGLNLSHNNLTGYIPISIGNLLSLEWLDLSSNKLIGKIPERLLDVTSLSVFNVSENQLEGQIPQGKQFNTFGNDSYEGNKGLCGFPVSKGCSNSEPPTSNLQSEDATNSSIAFDWKVVLTGYGCGVFFGLAMGYVVFQTGKPKWFVTLVEDRHHKRRKTSKIRNCSGGRRRT
ncbi:hypothetical protein PTKIN_Ptkin14bG0229300 [Pterospermum kingtungense]